MFLKTVALTALFCSLSGCGHAPAFSILGSYFPAWMLCAIVGILLAVALRLAVIRFQWEDHVYPTVLTYPCAAALFTFTLWLTFFS